MNYLFVKGGRQREGKSKGGLGEGVGDWEKGDGESTGGQVGFHGRHRWVQSLLEATESSENVSG